MRCFFDMEFTGLTQNAQPISIGLVSENERSFYAEFTDYSLTHIDDWVRDHVVSKLWMFRPTDARLIPGNLTYRTGTHFDIAIAVAGWLGQFPGTIEMWGDVLAYDWVHFCQLFGGAQKIPDSIDYIPYDLATMLKVKGIDPDIDRREFAGMKGGKELVEHNAVYDAMVLRACYRKLTSIEIIYDSPSSHPPEGYVSRLVKREEE